MFSVKKGKTENTIQYSGTVQAYADKYVSTQIMPEIMQRVADKYVEENYDDIIKLIDIDAFKANLTIALTVQASQKVRSSL
jgi:hypothetical protein